MNLNCFTCGKGEFKCLIGKRSFRPYIRKCQGYFSGSTPLSRFATATQGRRLGTVIFIISKDGSRSEVIIEDSSGLEAFEKSALGSNVQWRWKPAIRNVQPVDQSFKRYLIRFQIGQTATGASSEFLLDYNSGV